MNAVPGWENSKWDRGHTPVTEAVDRVELTLYQRLELAVLVNVLGVLRPLYWLVRRLLGKPFDVDADLETVRNVPCPTMGSRVYETHGSGYLTRAQVETFERDGVIEPLPFLTPEEAAELRDFYVRTHEADWHGKHIVGQQVVDELKANDLWGLKQAALWQELNFDQILDIMQRPILAERLASLLGDEVVSWRSQVFEIAGNTKGSFWHSASTFVEDGALPTLTAPEDMPPALVNINCWIALEDVDETNACMHVVPGSHVDGRMDVLLRRFMNDRIGFIMSYTREERRQALIAVRYSGDLFLASQLGFAKAMEIAPDMFDSLEPVAYPMKAGEVLIFSSNALHCSQKNTTSSTRLGMGIRGISADVEIYKGQPTIPFSTGSGLVDVPTKRLRQGTVLHTSDGAVATIDLREPGHARTY